MPNSKAESKVTLVDRKPGVVFVVRQLWVYRFLFDDGSTLDVIADRDDSDVRAAVLAHAEANKIEGVARIALDE